MRKVPAFRKCSAAFIKAIVVKLTSQVCLPGDVVVSQGEVATCMYFGACTPGISSC